jgi:glycogen operon protein
MNWESADAGLLSFVADIITVRREHPVFRRRRYFQGRPIYGEGVTDIEWFRPDGVAMEDQDWQAGYAKSVAVFLNGNGLSGLDARGEPLVDQSFLLLFNAHHEGMEFAVPPALGSAWEKVFDTASDEPVRTRPEPPVTAVLPGGSEDDSQASARPKITSVGVAARSLVVLRSTN